MNNCQQETLSYDEELSYPFAQVPEFGTCQEVAAGVYWLRMPLPFALDHINLWLLEDKESWTLVDCGVSTSKVKGLWEQLFSGFLNVKPIKRVIVSHCHGDHIGLAAWLTERFDAKLFMSDGEYQAACTVHAAGPGWLRQDSEQFLRSCGLPEKHIRLSAYEPSHYHWLVPTIPASRERLYHGMQLVIAGRTWQVLTARGHSPEHICLHCQELGILISCDQVLGEISSNISVWPDNPLTDPLGLYLQSLLDLSTLPPETLLLPSHGRPFYGLHQRLNQLKEHHAARLNLLRDACSEPQKVVDLLPVLFERDLDNQQRHFAIGEALAHLNHLVLRGEMKRELTSDQQWVFQIVFEETASVFDPIS